MAKKTGDKYINFQASEQEVDRLKAYCSAQNRTQTDVLRELLRSLPDILPDGWHESEFDGRIEGSHEGRRIAMYPQSNGWYVRISGESDSYQLANITALEAIEAAKALIDTH